MSVTPDEPDEPRREEPVPPESSEPPPPSPSGQSPPYGQPSGYGSYGYGSGAGYGGPPRQSTKAVAALILSIIGLLVCPFLFSVIGLVLAAQAKREIAASGGGLTGGGIAQAGFVISIIGLVFWVLGLLLSAAGVLHVNVPGT